MLFILFILTNVNLNLHFEFLTSLLSSLIALYPIKFVQFVRLLSLGQHISVVKCKKGFKAKMDATVARGFYTMKF